MFGKENIGLYRDDGLAIIKNRSARLADKTRKEFHKAFDQFGLKITAESNSQMAVNFIDVTFDLSTGKCKPYRKPNDDRNLERVLMYFFATYCTVTIINMKGPTRVL